MRESRGKTLGWREKLKWNPSCRFCRAAGATSDISLLDRRAATFKPSNCGNQQMKNTCVPSHPDCVPVQVLHPSKCTVRGRQRQNAAQSTAPIHRKLKDNQTAHLNCELLLADFKCARLHFAHFTIPESFAFCCCCLMLYTAVCCDTAIKTHVVSRHLRIFTR